MSVYVSSQDQKVPACRGKICEEAWLYSRVHKDGEGRSDFQVLYLRFRGESIWHHIFFDYGPLFWGQRHGDPFVKYGVDRNICRTEPDENGWGHELKDLVSGPRAHLRGLMLRTIQGGSPGARDVVVLTFDGGVPERDVHLLVWQNIVSVVISCVGAYVGPLPPVVVLDQDLT